MSLEFELGDSAILARWRLMYTLRLMQNHEAPPTLPHSPDRRVLDCARERPTMSKWLAIGGLLTLEFESTGCPALIVGSIVGPLGAAAGYEYNKTEGAAGKLPRSQPNAQPTPSLNDIE